MPGLLDQGGGGQGLLQPQMSMIQRARLQQAVQQQMHQQRQMAMRAQAQQQGQAPPPGAPIPQQLGQPPAPPPMAGAGGPTLPALEPPDGGSPNMNAAIGVGPEQIAAAQARRPPMPGQRPGMPPQAGGMNADMLNQMVMMQRSGQQMPAGYDPQMAAAWQNIARAMGQAQGIG